MDHSVIRFNLVFNWFVLKPRLFKIGFWKKRSELECLHFPLIWEGLESCLIFVGPISAWNLNWGRNGVLKIWG